MMPSEMEMPCCVRGYHVYKEVREAVIRKVLECHREPTNASFHVLNRSKNFRCIIVLCKKFASFFSGRKYFYDKKEANYGIKFIMNNVLNELVVEPVLCFVLCAF